MLKILAMPNGDFLCCSLRLPRFDMCSSRLCKSYRPYIVCYQLLFTWNQCKTLHHVLKLRIFWAVVGQSLPLALPHPRSQSLPCSRICRPSLTHIRFPLKCDFYCSKGAGSWISLSQPFPVSFWKGSAAMLHFLPHIFSGTNLDSKACLWWSLDFQRRKKIALKKKRRGPSHPYKYTQMHKHTNKSMLILHLMAPLSDLPWWSVLICGHLRPWSEVFPWLLST